MVIVTVPVTLAYRLIALEFVSDGSSWITMQRGSYVGGVFTADGSATQRMNVPVAATATILNALPTAALSRRNDLEKVYYEYLLAQGWVSGTIQ